MRKIVWVALLGLAVGSAGFVACGGTAETGPGGDGDGDAAVSSRDLCLDVCRDYSGCYNGGYGGGTSEDYYRSCRDSCVDAIGVAEDSGCEQSFRILLECTSESFSCSGAFGSGDLPCNRQTDRYVECISSSYGYSSGGS